MQPVYVYAPADSPDDVPAQSAKRRKVAKIQTNLYTQAPAHALKFEPLLSGLESPECVTLRQETFERVWSNTDAKIQVCVVQR